MEHLVTDCCGENILYEYDSGGGLTPWAFCKNCLGDDYKAVKPSKGGNDE